MILDHRHRRPTGIARPYKLRSGKRLGSLARLGTSGSSSPGERAEPIHDDPPHPTRQPPTPGGVPLLFRNNSII